MSDDFHESIGAAAGKVWTFLSESGPASATKLADSIGLERADVQRAIGWLAREGKVSVERKGKNEFFSLS
jgi:predicted ArsR family transcriptional regulator